jgi:hypothetical protein
MKILGTLKPRISAGLITGKYDNKVHSTVSRLVSMMAICGQCKEPSVPSKQEISRQPE